MVLINYKCGCRLSIVSPKLLPGPWIQRPLYGDVRSSFANVQYITQQCKIPSTPQLDSGADLGTTCNDVDQAGQGYVNLEHERSSQY